LLCAGCGGGGSAAPSGQVLGVREADFHITAPEHVAAGNVTFRVHNEGPDQHEFILVRSATGKLPLRSDGLTVDEDALAHEEVTSLDPAKAGALRDVTVHLRPGRYVLFCNMTGHYMAGMHRTLVVSG
jgi:uncharacterized cupredoxin-like copper-binding protein